MGSENRKTNYASSALGFVVGEGKHEIAQVAHLESRPFDLDGAAAMLTRIAKELPESVKVIVTGGGFVELNYPEEINTYAERRKVQFLADLRDWTEKQVADLVTGLGEIQGREFLVGVDVRVGEEGSGQFGLWVGTNGSTLVNKRFPVGYEATHLAGVDTKQADGPRTVQSVLGKVMVLVCHDAQAFNHFTYAKMHSTKRLTPRKRAMRELRSIAHNEAPKWMFDLIHSIKRPESLRTFKTSFKQINADYKHRPTVVGAFGYGHGTAKDAAEWLAQLRRPQGINAVTVVIEPK